MTDQELTIFLTHCPTWLRLYVQLKLLTGLRQGDLLRLKWEQVQPLGLEVQISKTGRGNMRRGKTRVLFEMTDKLNETLNALRKLYTTSSLDTRVGSRQPTVLRSEYLFPNRMLNEPRTQSSLDSAIDRVWLKLQSQNIDLPKFTEHDLRAKSATDAGALGLDATALLAHSSRKMTETYLRRRRVRRVKPSK